MESLDVKQARTVEEAVALISQGASPIAGGTTLVPQLTRRLGTGRFVDIGRLGSLRGIDISGEQMRIGALTSVASLTEARDVLRHAPALAAAALGIGNPHVRRAGTLGGNVAFGRPGADLVPALVVLDAVALLRSADGERRMPVAELVASGVPAGALIVALLVPLDAARSSGVRKFAWRRSTAVSVATAAVSLKRIGAAVVAPRLVAAGLCRAARLKRAEASLEGNAPVSAILDAAAAAAAGEAPCEEPSDPESSYRRRLLETGFRSLLGELTAPMTEGAP